MFAPIGVVQAKVLAELSNLDDPRLKHIVRCYSAWIQDSTLYIQMELCDSSLRKVNLTENQKTDCFAQISSALVLIHERNIVHLDIKPDNIFVVRNVSNNAEKFTFKLGDFGIAIKRGDEVFRTGDSRYADVSMMFVSRLIDSSKVTALFPLRAF